MSRYFNSFIDDPSEELEHSWGTSPKAKAREKEYNQKHKAEIEAVRKQRNAATNSYKQAEKSYKDTIRYQGLSDQMDARQKYSAESEAKRILRAMKNPSAKELAEFYLDTTVAKAKKLAKKAKTMPTVEETANKAKKYVTKTVKKK